jgi:hypothetical protein
MRTIHPRLLTLIKNGKRNGLMTGTATQTNATPHISAKRKLYSPRKFTARTKARFTLDRTAELVGHLGRPPNYPEQLIIDRIVNLEWWLRRLDARLDAGEDLSGHAIRGRLAAETRLRLDLAALKPVAPKQMTALDYAQAIAEGRVA